MDELITVSKSELDRLRQRVRRLALEKSYLQLANDLMNALSRVSGLEKTVEEIMRILVDNMGGTGVGLYYFVQNQLHYADVYGEKTAAKDVTDPIVERVLATRQFIEEERAYEGTKMLTPAFTRASYWALPLMVGDQLIGVLKIDGMLMAARDVRQQLQPFFNYAALVLKNEVENDTRLSELNARLRQTNEDLVSSKAQLLAVNEQLETRVVERTSELEKANEQLAVQLGERERAEEALRARTEELDHFFNIAPDLLCISNTSGQFLRLNRAWETTLGYSIDELTKSRFFDFVHPDDLGPTIEAVAALEAQRTIVDFVNRYRCKDGTYRWIEWRSVPSGHLIHAAARDVTEQKAAQDELRLHREHLEELVTERTRALEAANRELEAANRELEAFSYSVSHDLRTPLRAIEGFSRKLELNHSPRLDDEGLRLVHVVRQNALRMARLIDDILSFSRSGRIEMRRSPVDMERLARDVWVELEPDRAGRDVRFNLGPLPPAEGDPAMLRQVWLNLLGNAIKFTETARPAIIEVGAARTESACTYSVKDNGVGFDERFADKLFGVFQRLHGLEEFPGTGIGLAIVKRIVLRHGGDVSARGAVGEGATVSFTLPLSARGIPG